MGGTHAILGASSSNRWMNCPGSVREIARLPQSLRNSTSVYADEGTCAHELCERVLTDPDAMDDASYFLGDMIQGELKKWEVTEEMAEAVQLYVDTVREHQRRLGSEGMAVEVTVRPFDDRDDMYGISDVILMGATEIVVGDYKHGVGIVVDPDWNSQEMYYGLGAYRMMVDAGLADNIKTVRLMIVQPRAFHPDGPVREWVCSIEDLLSWGETLRAAADRTAESDAPLNPGEWCQFCPANRLDKNGCPAKAAARKALFRDDWSDIVTAETTPEMALIDPTELSMESLAEAMEMIRILEPVIKQTKKLARDAGEKNLLPGHKMVRGKKGNRKWANGDRVRRAIAREHGAAASREPGVTLGPVRAEKLMGEDWVNARCNRSEGKLHLVPKSDERPAVNLIEDFAEEARKQLAADTETGKQEA